VSLQSVILTDQQKKDRSFDYLDGFEVIDRQRRIYVIEGLSDMGIKNLLQ
jgi:hypothetical protein